MWLLVRVYLTKIPFCVFVLCTAAFLGKLLGAGIPTYCMGFSPQQADGIGIAMSARGAVELIIAGIAIEYGLFNHPSPAPTVVDFMFSAIVIMTLLTTLVAPVAMRDADTLEDIAAQNDTNAHETKNTLAVDRVK